MCTVAGRPVIKVELVEAHSCVGRFKQEVNEQFGNFKQGEGLKDVLAQEPLSTAYRDEHVATPHLFEAAILLIYFLFDKDGVGYCMQGQ